MSRPSKREYEIRFSSKGYPFRVYPVPQIKPGLLDAVVYLYPSIEAANSNDQAGGSGFSLVYPAAREMG